MGDVITGIDFAADSARERFIRRRQAIGLSDPAQWANDPDVKAALHRQDTTPSEYVAPDGDCA